MGQATLDLPDPLLATSPADAKSADDLLSQLAGDEIDRLLAENDEPPAKAADPRPAVAADPTQDLDAVLAQAAADRDASAERLALQDPQQDAVPVQNEKLPAHASPEIELGDNAVKLPMLFRPLEWLSAPLDPWPDQLRELMGKAGLITLINALAVLGYVLYRRHHP